MKGEISNKLLKEIVKQKDSGVEKLFLDDNTFKAMSDPLYGYKENEEKAREELKEIYRNIVDLLKKYVDIKEEYYPLIAIWIMGTYIHEEFMSYPYLYLNAMRGSGKTRLLKIIACLSKNGEMLNSLTEAVLFRTTGTLCIDEFEGLERKGKENLRELLNSAYKKGTKVKRLKKVKTLVGEEQQVEEFNVYRPLAIANITGMENVMADRCLRITIEKSNKKNITKLMEIFENEKITTHTKQMLNLVFLSPEKAKSEKKGVVSVDVVSVGNVYKLWNDYVTYNYTNYTKHTNNTNYTNNTLLQKVMELDVEGRHLELAMPLFIIASLIEESVLDEILSTFKNIIEEKKEEDISENRDVMLYDFLSQELEDTGFITVGNLCRNFKEFLQTNDEEINTKWLGRALKRLGLIIEKRRTRRGVEVVIDYKKAKQKIMMFK